MLDFNICGICKTDSCLCFKRKQDHAKELLKSIDALKIVQKNIQLHLNLICNRIDLIEKTLIDFITEVK